MNLIGLYIGYQFIEGITKGILIGVFTPCEEKITMIKLGDIYKGSIRK